MTINWPAIIQPFSGILTQIPAHLAPSVIFNNNINNINNINKICSLTNVGFLSVQGIDSEKFLQGQLTCDMREVSQDHTKLSGHCNPKGRLHGIFQVIQLDINHYCLAMPTIQLNHMQASLQKYAIFSKVNIAKLELYSFGIIGVKNNIEKINFNLSKLDIYQKLNINLDINLNIHHKLSTITYLRLPCHDENLYRFMIVFHPETLDTIHTLHTIHDYWHQLIQLGFDHASTTIWHQFNLLALMPNIYPETTEKHLVHPLNLPQMGAVSFKKGCYTGQEIVARMEYLGKSKKTLACREFQAQSSTLPVLGEDLIDYTPLSLLTPQNQHYLGLFIVNT